MRLVLDTNVVIGAVLGSDLIISGDADLLNVKSFHRIPIVTPAEALARLQRQHVR